MTPINRSVAIVRPKQPFVDWANQLPDAGNAISLHSLQSDCLTILIPEYAKENEAKVYIDLIYEEIFEEELSGWCGQESWWPQDRTEALFWQWFEMEFHSIVMDSCESDIDKEMS